TRRCLQSVARELSNPFRGVLHGPGTDWRVRVRRIVSGAASYLAGLGRGTVRGWNAFFFTPGDPTALGLIRLATGLLAFWSLLVYGLDLRDYFGSDGWADPAAVRL